MNIITPSKEQRKRSAADIFAAFEYQWDHFVLMLLKENDSETIVSFELFDDVDVQKNDYTRLSQIKHSVRKNANGETINLSNRDADLWKTISIWMKVIDEQPNVLENLKFQLLTNKAIFENSFVKAIEVYEKDRSVENLKSKILEIRNSERIKNDKSVPKSSKQQGLNVSTVIDELLTKDYWVDFCIRISISKTPDILKDEIKNMMCNRFGLNQNRIDLVYNSLMTNLRDDAIENIEKGDPVSYNGSIFTERYQSILDIGRKKIHFRTDFSIQDFSGEPRELLFLKQLFLVCDTKGDDLDRIAELTFSWLCFNNNLQEHWNNNDLIRNDVDELTVNVCSAWRNCYHSKHRKITLESTNEELCEAGCYTIDEMRNKQFSLADNPLGDLLSEGCIYYYSNYATDIIPELPLIGWHRDWKNKFNNNEQSL